MKRLCLMLMAALAIPSLAAAQATDYPNRPVKVIVPFPPGSGADTVARFAAKQLEEQLGQPFVVDNRGGANGAIGLAAARNSPADGYTIVLGSSGTMAINPIFMKEVGYDAVKDFKPLSGLTRTHAVWVVPASSGIKTVADLVNAAKASPGKVNVGTYTSSYALLLEWFNGVADVKIANIPYKAIGQAQVDLFGGQLDAVIMDITSAIPMVQSGKVRAIATVGSTRSANYPNMPTFAESGYPAYVNYLWNGIFVRTETPSDATAKLASALQKVLAGNAFAEYNKANGVEALPLGPDAMRKYHLDDLATLRGVANAAGVKPE